MTTNRRSQINFLRCSKVLKKTGHSRSTLYNILNPHSKYHDPSFPKQVRLGLSSVAWVESEIDDWLEGRINASRGEVKH